MVIIHFVYFILSFNELINNLFTLANDLTNIGQLLL